MPVYNEIGFSEQDREKRRRLVNNVYNGCPSLEAKTLAEKLEELEEEKRKLVDEIDKQPVTNLNLRTRKKNEKKLPRKLRKGW